ncbi:tandem-95 repeat protein [Aquabacterium sp. A08]|uniref:tandem-95 repeat protein n=1 Tax=Aquabacterium sp. A08 TaxID=2718532 RepID=UPI001421F098|nr:Ig-like domain-containing protein [Aquabacterium sp. A08]NIC42192.1 tandem-95 repeat protein [Aquabacterium sp. A08]
MNPTLSAITSATAQLGNTTRQKKLVRKGPAPMALEQRFMFDGAALVDALHITDATDSHDTTTEIVDVAPIAVEVPPLFRTDLNDPVLAMAMAEADQAVKDFIANADAPTLFNLFNGGLTEQDAAWTARLADLRTALQDGRFNLNVVAMDSASVFTTIAAYTHAGPDGQPTVFINPYWFDLFAGTDATKALVEELGHAIDDFLNPNGDTDGDEGAVFAAHVMPGEPTTLAESTLASDTGRVTVNGVSYEVEFASFKFSSAYEMVYDQNADGIINTTERWADKEQNLHYFDATHQLNEVQVVDGTGDRNFSGNDVSVTSIVINGETYYGWISRPIKANGVVRGFYFWTDVNFIDFGTAQADSNADGDSNVMDNRGFLLVVDQAWFDSQITATGVSKTINSTKDGNLGTITVANVGSSSDRVDSALNSLLPPNTVTAVADALTIAEDSGPHTGNLLSNDSDPTGDTFTLTSFTVNGTTYTGVTLTGDKTLAGVGTMNISSTGAYTFTPAANFYGPVPPITYTITDAYGATSTATFSINVTAVNDAPSGTDDAITTPENIPMVLGLNDFGTYSDPENDPLVKIQITELATDGTLQYWNGSAWVPVTLNQDITVAQILQGRVRFAPDNNESGNDYATVQFKVSDGQAYSSSTYTLTVHVTPGNQAPVANADTNSVNEAGCGVTAAPATGNVLADGTPDSDANSDTLTVTGITAYGNTQNVTSGTTSANGTAIAGQYGTLTIGANGSYAYVLNNALTAIDAMNSGDSKTETFSYTISDGNGGTATTTLTLTINGTNDAPLGVDDFSSFEEGTNQSAGNYGTITVGAKGVLANDSDVDNTNGELVVKLVDGTTPPTGSDVTLSASSPITSVTLVVTQVSGSWTAIVPTSPAQPVWLDAAQTKPALDKTGAQLTVYRSGSGGTATLIFSDNVALYNYENTNLYIKDPGNSNVATVSVDITSANTSSSTTISTTSDVSGISAGDEVSGTGIPAGTTVVSVDTANKTITLSQAVNIANTSLTFTDPNGITVTATATQQYMAGNYGYLILNQDGGYTYTLTTDLSATQVVTERFTYTVVDPANGCSGTATINIRVYGVDAPNLGNDTLVVSESTGTHVTFNGAPSGSDSVKSNDADGTGGSAIALGDVASFKVAGDSATYAAGSTATITGVGTLTINASGSVAFDPVDNYIGPVPTVTYTRTGSDGQPYTANLTITIQPVDDASVLTPDSQTIDEDSVATGNVLANDSDIDSVLTVASFSVAGMGTSPTVGTPFPITDGSGAVGSITLNSNGSYSFTPSANWNGTVPVITYTTNTGASSTLSITVTPVNDAPALDLDTNDSTVAGTGFLTTYSNAGTPVPIGDTDVTITDIDDTNIENATIVLTNPQPGDALNTGTLPNGITVGTTPMEDGVITITLTGSASLADYQAAIRSITFSSTGTSTVDRVVSVKVNDGSADSNTAYTTIDVNPDNRLLTVMGSIVNEASPYVVFEVTGAENQWITLALGETGNGAGHADMGTDFLPNLQYFDGSGWVNYTGGLIQIPDTTADDGKLLVRTAVLQDSAFETTSAGFETLKLTAYNAAGTANVTSDAGNTQADGTSQIRDDGQGQIFKGTNNTFTPDTNNVDPNTGPVLLDDDRPLTVNDIQVNESSPFGVFTISGAANQWTQLNLSSGTATGSGTDFGAASGTGLQYWNGSTWATYNTGAYVQLDAGGKLLVRTPIVNDSPFEGPETFFLSATNTGGTTANGSGTILDDGTGTQYPDQSPGAGLTPVTDNTSLNDDRTIDVVGGLTFNEASTYATFTVTGQSGYELNLALGNTPSTADVDATTTGFTVDFSVDGGTTWTAYTWDGTTGDRPMVPGSTTPGGNTGTVLVRVNITTEADTPYEGAETFTLLASYATNSSITDTDTNSIVDDETGKIDNDGDGGADEGGTKDDDRVVVTSADLITTKVLTSGDATPAVGDTVVFTVTVRNNGSAQATGVSLSESWPSGLNFVNATASQGSYNSGTGLWSIGTLNNGDSATLTLTGTVKVGEGGRTLTNTVSAASGDQPDPTDAGNDLSEAVVVDAPPAPAPEPPPPPAPESAPAPAPAPAPSDIPPEPLPAFNSATVMQVSSAEPQLYIGTFPVEAILTSDIGFPVVVAEPGNPALPPNLTLANAVTDQFADPGIESRFAIPYDTFAHTKADAQITLIAKLQHGSELPDWVVFDPQSGTFTVNPPADLPPDQRELKLMVIARDQEGREAVAPFRFFVGDDKAKPKLAGRPSLTEQLKLAGKRSQTPWADWSRAPVEAKPVARGPAAERAAAQAG